jgi:CheY-like chemotaxis protein
VIDINRLLGDISELLRRTLGETVRIESNLARALPAISVDRAQMESAILNLAINARDAMGGAGTLRIATSHAVVTAQDSIAETAALAPGDYVIVSVADTGSGMSPEVAARAIEPFFTTKEVGRGTGLGLSQVYGFVRQSGGHVEIDSKEGVGTDVRLYFPCHGGDGAAPYVEADPAQPLQRGSPGEVILAVEDEDQVRRTTIDALLELGYGVREARSGVEALAILASDPSIALLFTDIVKPGMDGRQLAERALRQRPDLKLLYTTGYAPESGAVPRLDEEHFALLRKPFGVAQLATKLRDILDA